MNSYCIIIADDHVLLRQGLKRIIEETAEYEVVGEAGDGVELIRVMNKTATDMVILDISMPIMRGLEAIREIKCRHPAVKVLILTMHKDNEYLYQALTSGADGYLLKEDADTELFSAIKQIRTGKFYASPFFSSELEDYWKKTPHGEFRLTFKRKCLTTREIEVLKLIAEGQSSREIAGLLNISVRTVDHHRANIMEKLELRKTAELVKYAISNGFVQTVPR